MLYTDLFFLLALLPLSVIFSFFDESAEYKNMVLIISGLIFISWGRPVACLLILLSFLFDWAMGLAVGRLRSKSKAAAAFFLMLDMLFNAAIFIVYTRADVISLPDKLTVKSTLIPFAMGYYVLRAFSYVYDIYMGEEPEKNPLCLLTYMASFHFMMCGPLVRYKDIKPQIRERKPTGKMLSAGFDHIVLGLAKVVLAGHALQLVVNAGLDFGEMTLIGCWLGMAAFFGNAYFTLSGLCEMSMGMGLLNGFTYKSNFDDLDSKELFTGLVRGYNSSVTGFFSEAVCSPFRDKKILHAISAFICCMTVAAWYSFSKPAFIAGAAVGAVVVLEMIFGDKLRKLPTAVRFIYLTVLSMLIFGAVYFGTMYGWRKWALGLVGVGDKYFLSKQLKEVLFSNLFIFIVGIIYFLPAARGLVTKGLEKIQSRSSGLYTFVEVTKTAIKAILFVMCIAMITVGKM